MSTPTIDPPVETPPETPVDASVGTAADADAQAGELAGRLFLAGIGAFELLTIHVGLELGLYDAVRAQPAITSAQLAGAAGIAERYAREWLEQQAAAGLLDCDDVTADPDARRFALPPGHAQALLDEQSLAYVAPLSRMVAGAADVLPRLAEVYRSGGGIPFGDYGDNIRLGQAAFNRPAFSQLLASTWLPDGAGDVHARLQAAPPARVLDVGTGAGWSSIALALGYPTVHVHGTDLDEPSIAMARASAAAAGVDDRVVFSARDAADVPDGPFDVAFLFEVLHDLPHPVETLAAVRTSLAPGASVIVMDEAAGEEFTAPADELERFLYAASVLHCLPVGMSAQPSAGTGTVLRPTTLRRYAREAGYASVEVLPIEHDFFRFYRLQP